jgi:hypothetical protein
MLSMFAGALLSRAAPSAATTSDVVWCSHGIDVPDGSELARGVSALCRGDAETAVSVLRHAAPDFGGGEQFGTFQRSRWLFFALIAAHRDDEALGVLKAVDPSWKAGPAERAFFDGDYAHSYALYVAQDGSYPRDPDHQDAHKLDPHLPAALAKVKSGDIAGAVAEDAKSASGGSLYSLMSGDLYAANRDWKGAFRKWVEASMVWSDEEMYAAGGIGWPVEDWNIDALAMIYYYRAHAPN